MKSSLTHHGETLTVADVKRSIKNFPDHATVEVISTTTTSAEPYTYLSIKVRYDRPEPDESYCHCGHLKALHYHLEGCCPRIPGGCPCSEHTYRKGVDY